MPCGGRQPRGATQAHLLGETTPGKLPLGETRRCQLGGPSGRAVDAHHVLLLRHQNST